MVGRVEGTGNVVLVEGYCRKAVVDELKKKKAKVPVSIHGFIFDVCMKI